MDNLDAGISDNVNLVIIFSKFQIHSCEWNGFTPCFTLFTNYYANHFTLLKCMEKLEKKAKKLRTSIFKFLLF